MKVIYGIGRIKEKFPRPVVSIGVFDGLHLGHQYLIKKTVQKAKSLNGTSIVLTFFPHPIHILHPDVPLSFLVSLPHRLRLIEEMGVDVCIVISFTKKFSKLTPRKFMDRCLVKTMHPREIFVGRDFRFGIHRSGDLHYLKRAGCQFRFKVNTISFVRKNNRVVSSTVIRKLIVGGKIDQASQLLGRPVSFFGEVKRGDGRGRRLGFPTVNLNPSGLVIPPCGVYLAQVILEGTAYPSMANLGWRPSFRRRNKKINIEAHIFDFKKNIYGKEVEVVFLSKIRNEKKFDSQKELIEQITKDERKARGLFTKLK